MTKVAYLLAVREDAVRCGDRGLYRSLSADLARLGYVDGPRVAVAVETAVPAVLESPEVPALPPVAVEPEPEPEPEPEVKRRGGRPPMPRCEHGKIVGRCRQCATEE